MSQASNTQRPGGPGPMRGPMGGGGPMGAIGRPVEKAKNFRGTLQRFMNYFVPQKWLLVAVLITAIIGTTFNIVGPKILGLATTKLFNGLIDKYKAVYTDQKLHLNLPVPGIDFGYIGQVLLI